ncbi:DUF512 domain-containing protein [candidate division KSB1 bacterium]|nr:DUF512 domain-containing protein [candidate division KSB1 bacterium]
MIISKVNKSGIGHEIGLLPGDHLIGINNFPINDIIDYRYHIADEFIELRVERSGELFTVELEKDPDEELGLEFEPVKYRHCGNKCIFCFIDQNPDNLRANLYFKDEDFRLSFLHGNYVTLSNTSRKDLERIVQQRLSPLYVSVHTTDSRLRSVMLGRNSDDALLEKLTFLTRNNIEIHTQVVLCPGINDGNRLIDTVERLSRLQPGVQSVAIVPVGLTKYRENLPLISPVTEDLALQTIDTIEALAGKYKGMWDSHFVYLADEFYIKAAQPLPASSRYDEFPQYENGVGMMRYFLDNFAEQARQFPRKIRQRSNINIVTAALAQTYIENNILSVLNKIENLAASLTVVKNKFYGDNITVTGLMAGQDICTSCSTLSNIDMYILPKNCLNGDGLTIDDWTVDDLTDRLSTHVEVIDMDFRRLLRKL